MNLLEKQLSTVYFKDVRFLWVTLYFLKHAKYISAQSELSLVTFNANPLHEIHNTSA